MASNSAIKDLRNFLYGLLSVGFVMLLISLYYSNYTFLKSTGLTLNGFDAFLAQRPGWSFFGTTTPRYIALILASLMIFFPGHSKQGDIKTSIILGASSGTLFFLLGFISYNSLVAQFVMILLSLSSFIIYVISLKRISSWFTLNSISLDENQKEADGFDQNTILIETPHSVNIEYTFHKNNQFHKGWINLISLFRATSVIGMPGTGKSYAFLQQIMRQTIMKGFCGVVYDYKDPTLATSTYNYYMEMKDINPESKMQFGYISFKNLNKTYRCNPLKGIDSAAEARDVAFTILASLNPQSATKQGDFFVESSISFVALNIYLLGLVKQGKHLSLPHVISALSSDKAMVFDAFGLMSVFYSDMRAIFTPFFSAYESGATQQLEGQLASAQIGLSGIADAGLAYVMTEDDKNFELNIDLDLNSKDDPKIICLGNDPLKDKTYGLACSVYLARISKMINKKGIPCLYVVDELPTVYVKGIDNLIATARSNDVAVLLGYQDHTQIIRDYGTNVAEAIINTTANTIAGAVKGKTAQTLAQSFGEKIVVKKNASRDSDGKVSNTFSESKEKRIPQERIEELSQGEFVGRIVDTFKNKTKNKVFEGEIHVPDLYNHEPYQIPALRAFSDFEIGKMLAENQIRINNEVDDILVRINYVARYYKALKENTLKTTALGAISLELYVEDKERTEGLSMWCELAHSIINTMTNTLQLKNDFLTIEAKIELLLRSVWKQSPIIEQLMADIQNLGFMDFDTCKEHTQEAVGRESSRDTEDQETYE